MGKTNSLNESDLTDFIKLAKTQKLSDNSWSIDIEKMQRWGTIQVVKALMGIPIIPGR